MSSNNYFFLIEELRDGAQDMIDFNQNNSNISSNFDEVMGEIIHLTNEVLGAKDEGIESNIKWEELRISLLQDYSDETINGNVLEQGIDYLTEILNKLIRFK